MSYYVLILQLYFYRFLELCVLGFSCLFYRYLCEFSYYTSLCVSGQSSLFVHVPEMGKPYLPEQTAQGICEIIRLAVAQINDKSCDCSEVVSNSIVS